MAASGGAGGAGASPGARILLAEDDPIAAAIIQQKLESRGYAVQVFDDGKAALEAVLASPYDLLILDVSLPGLDGFGILHEVRHRPGLKTLPVMMLTGKRRDGDVRLGVELGASDYLIKPFMPFEVLRRVERLLARRAPGEA